MMDSISQRTRSADPWRRFVPGAWQSQVDVCSFVRLNRRPYQGTAEFLDSAKMRTDGTPSAHALETALRAVGVSSASTALHGAGAFTRLHAKREAAAKLFTPQMLFAIDSGLLSDDQDALQGDGLAPDCCRVALYGVDMLRRACQQRLKADGSAAFTPEAMRVRSDLSAQMQALDELRETALAQRLDIGRPAANAGEVMQWICMAWTVVASEQGARARFPLAHVVPFLDIYLERDMEEGRLTESQAQELVDDMMDRLGFVQRLHEAESGWPLYHWSVPSPDGMGDEPAGDSAQAMRTSFRVLNALRRLPAEAAPCVTVVGPADVSAAFREFCGQVSLETAAIRFDKGQALCHSPADGLSVAHSAAGACGAQQVLQRTCSVNLPKALLYAINGGVDEESGVLVIPGLQPFWGDVLQYEEVIQRLNVVFDVLAAHCVNAFNAVQYLGDQHANAHLAAALHDRDAVPVMICGLDGLATLADSLSAIRYAGIQVERNEDGLAEAFRAEGAFPRYADQASAAHGIANVLSAVFQHKLHSQPFIYRDAMPMVLATGVSANAVAGGKTGQTPCGRRAGDAFPVWSPVGSPLVAAAMQDDAMEFFRSDCQQSACNDACAVEDAG